MIEPEGSKPSGECEPSAEGEASGCVSGGGMGERRSERSERSQDAEGIGGGGGGGWGERSERIQNGFSFDFEKKFWIRQSGKHQKGNRVGG